MTQRVLPSGGMPDSSAMRWTGRGGTRRTRRKSALFFTRSDRGKRAAAPPPAVQQQSQSGGEQGGREQDQRAVARPGPCPFLRPQRAAEEEPAHVALRPRPLPGQLPGPAGPSPPPPCRSFSPDGTPVPGISGVWRPPWSHNIPPGPGAGQPPPGLSDSSSAPQSPSDRARSPGKDGLKGGGPCLLLPQRRQVPAQTTQLTQPAPRSGRGPAGTAPVR